MFRGALRKNQVAALLVAALLLLPALFWGPQQQRLIQLSLYGLIGEVLLLVWLLRRELPVAQIRRIALEGPTPYVLGYMAWSGFGLLYTIDSFYTQLGFLQLAFGVLLYAITAWEFRERSLLRTLLGAFLVLAVGPVLWAFLLAPDGRWHDRAGTVRDWQLFGGYLALLCPVLLGMAAGTSSSFARWMGGIALGLTVLGLLLTGCRSAWIGAAFGVLLFIGLYRRYVGREAGGRERIRRLAVLLGLLLLVLGSFLAVSAAGQGVRKRATTLTRLEADSGMRDRLVIWDDAVRVFSQRALTGWGLGSYPIAQARLGLGSRSERLIREAGPSLADSAHNLYLQIAAEQGIPGFVLYVLVLVAFFGHTARSLPFVELPLRRATLIGCMAAVGGQCLDAFANPGWVYPEIATLFWVVLGAGIGLASRLPVRIEAPGAARQVTNDAPIPGLPVFLYRALRTAGLGCVALWIASHLVWLGTGIAPKASGPERRAMLSAPPAAGGIARLQLDLLGDATPPPAAFARTAASLIAPTRGGASVRFKVYALSADGASRMDVTGEGPNRLSVRLLTAGASTPDTRAFEGGEISFGFVVLPPDRGRQLLIRFRKPIRRPVVGTVEVGYRYGRAGDDEVVARFELTLAPPAPLG